MLSVAGNIAVPLGKPHASGRAPASQPLGERDRVVRKLTGGGMARVHLARDATLARNMVVVAFFTEIQRASASTALGTT